ncbi:MAG: hypothetical protein AAB567_02710, partial [Patescibacteria group bacterium]
MYEVEAAKTEFEGESILAFEIYQKVEPGWKWGRVEPDPPLSPYYQLEVQKGGVVVKNSYNSARIYGFGGGGGQITLEEGTKIRDK